MKVGNVGKFPVRLAMIYSQSDFANRGIDRRRRRRRKVITGFRKCSSPGLADELWLTSISARGRG